MPGRAGAGRKAIIPIGGAVKTVGARRGHAQTADTRQGSFLPDIERYRCIDSLAHQVETQRRNRYSSAFKPRTHPEGRGGLITADYGLSCLQVGIHHDILSGKCIKIADCQGLIIEIMDPDRIGTTRQDIEQLIPAMAIGGRVVLGIGRLMDSHYGHAFDGPVFVHNPACNRSRRHLRRRRQRKQQNCQKE